MKRAKTIPARNVKMVKERSGGVCEGCGQRPATQIHHRKFRARGGGHQVSNLLHLCGSGNAAGCHGLAHSAYPPLGWTIPSGVAVPAHEPVLYRGERVLLDDAGVAYSGLVVF